MKIPLLASASSAAADSRPIALPAADKEKGPERRGQVGRKPT
jgi:hypothetical protein